MLLQILYHFSPKARREAILREGLRLLSPARVHSGGFRAGYLCFGVTPRAAWTLSGGFAACDGEEEAWDLWQVEVAQTDEVHVLEMWGPEIREVRLHNSVPADRLFWLGERTVYVHETLDLNDHLAVDPSSLLRDDEPTAADEPFPATFAAIDALTLAVWGTGMDEAQALDEAAKYDPPNPLRAAPCSPALSDAVDTDGEGNVFAVFLDDDGLDAKPFAAYATACIESERFEPNEP